MGDIFAFIQNNFVHVAPILVSGIFAIVIVLERWFSLSVRYPIRGHERFFERARELLIGRRVNDCIALCDQNRSKPAAQILRAALLRIDQPEVVIEDGISLSLSESLSKIQNRTQFLSMIANVATLFGLFGTILGLIQSFHAVGEANAQQRATILAQGISTAMNATLLGLAVAIPSMIAFSFLINKANRLTGNLERAAIRSLDLVRMAYMQNTEEKAAVDFQVAAPMPVSRKLAL